MNNYQFYLVPAELWTTLKDAGIKFILLECQPYGEQRLYRIATLIPVKSLVKFECKDTGRTQGFFQCYLGTGIYRTKGKIKLPKIVQSIVKQLETGVVSFDRDTWTEIIEGWFQKMKLAREAKNNEGDK